MSKPIKDSSLVEFYELDSLVEGIESDLKHFAHIEEYVPDGFVSELKKFRNEVEREFEKRSRF